MSRLNNEELKQKIEERLPGIYPEQGMELVLEKINNMDPDIRENVEKYLQTGEIQEIEVEGYTVKSFMDGKNMNPLAAYLSLDWLIREPEKAKESLNRKVDYVEINKSD